MRFRGKALWTALRREQDGQAIAVVALSIALLLAMTAAAVDIGHVYLCHRELQTSCDAAALAGATLIPTATMDSAIITAATNYSAVSGGRNQYSNMGTVSMVPGYPQLRCLATMQLQGISCVGYRPYNAVTVKEQAAVPLYFAKIFGKSSMTISAGSTAAKGGGSSRPYNIAIMLDTTLSMDTYDADCGATQMQCSLNGVQVLLKYLDPCGTSQVTCTISQGNSQNSVVRVSLFTFPQVQYPTLYKDTTCANSPATSYQYTFPLIGAVGYTPGTLPTSTTYQVTPFQSDYRVSDTSTLLNPNSTMVLTTGGVAGCAGLQTPNNAGYYGTYYGATMYAAQSALVAQQLLNPGTQNVLIILGDGDANSPQYNGSVNGVPVTPMGPPATNTGLYPSYWGECGQAIDAAAYATGQGTAVYTVAYGSPSSSGTSTSGCRTDSTGQGHLAGTHPNISPCNEMAAMATHSWYFFSDYKQTGADTSCVAAQVVTSLNAIFLQIAGDLTVARLIPDNTT